LMVNRTLVPEVWPEYPVRKIEVSFGFESVAWRLSI